MVIVFALLVYGLERNHYRQQRRRPLGAHEMLGSTDVEDRDLARMRAEFRAITADEGSAVRAAHRPPSIPGPRAAAPACRTRTAAR